MKVGFVSLGCSKNLIDTEVLIGIFKKNHYNIINEAEQADILVVNTCGFIESAKQEAINTILEMAEYKKDKCQCLIVMGCLVQRYYQELIKALPEVDLFLKIEQYDKMWDKIEETIFNNKNKQKIILKKETEKKSTLQKIMPMLTQQQFMSRVITTGNDYAYLKIGEGCSNRCTYCAIPSIRGSFVSRKKQDIIEEAKNLANQGIKELILIAQDTTKYGIDIEGKSCLPSLLEELVKIEKIQWIRFLYSYPEGITEELIEIVAKNEKIANYFDIPIQHVSNNILKKMNRKTTKEQIEKLISNIRKKIPEVTLRTSLIVGFPGETQEQFQELAKFVENVKFDKLGVFMYSKEEGTPAAKLPEQIHLNTKKARYRNIMKIQQQISKENLAKWINQKVTVLIESISFDGNYYIGRTLRDVPDIDGLVYIKNEGSKKPEEILHHFVTCKIIQTKEYDFIATLCMPLSEARKEGNLI